MFEAVRKTGTSSAEKAEHERKHVLGYVSLASKAKLALEVKM